MGNILGFNTLNILVILLIMLIVAGPKRMIEWAYQIGRYITKFRGMFQETMNAVHKEIQAADPGLAKDLSNLANSRFDIVSEANKLLNVDLNPTVKNTAPANTAPVAPIQIVSNETPSAAEATQPQPADDEKPRYDAWLQN